MLRLLLIAPLLLSFTATGQDTVFYDKKWKVLPSPENAAFFRPAPELRKGKYKVVDYHISGDPQMIGYYKANGNEFSDADKSKDGKFEYFRANGKKESEVVYKDGNEVKRKYYDENGKQKPATLFKYVEQMPEIPYDLGAFIGAQLVYPEEARLQLIEGSVNIKFIVDTDGTIKEATVVKSVHPLLDSAAVKVVSSMPPWKPGSQNGKLVKVYFTLPIKFALQDDKEMAEQKGKK